MQEDDLFSQWMLYAAARIPESLTILFGLFLCTCNAKRLPRSTKLMYIALIMGAAFSSGVLFLVYRIFSDDRLIPEPTTSYFMSVIFLRIPFEFIGCAITILVSYAVLVPESRKVPLDEEANHVG